jgi:DNA-binding response OmpR family regulator
MQVVLLSTDLMVVSRVQGAAARTGASVRVAADVPAAAKLHGDLPADLVIADLATSPLAIDSLISQLKANAKPPARVVAFGPHVHEEWLAAARAAGCDVVMARGQFFSQVESLLAADRKN